MANNQHVIEPHHGVLKMNEIMTLQLAEYKDLDMTAEDIGDLEWDDKDEEDFSNYRDGQVVSARLM